MFILFLVLVIGFYTASSATEGNNPKPPLINVTTEVILSKDPFKVGEPIDIILRIINGLKGPIFHQRFSLVPDKYNSETFNVGLTDIYRSDRPKGNLFLSRPVINIPVSSGISGPGISRIEPGKSLDVLIDLSKWTIKDGWKEGDYVVIVKIDNLILNMSDPLQELSISTLPFKFTVKK